MPNSPTSKPKPWHTKRVPFQRSVDNSKFYNSWPWRKTRKAFLNQNPLCVHCGQNGIHTEATVVDHIKRIEDGGAKLDFDNLQGLCSSHHNSKSGKEAHQNKITTVKNK